MIKQYVPTLVDYSECAQVKGFFRFMAILRLTTQPDSLASTQIDV
jgi:hypothetical protein